MSYGRARGAESKFDSQLVQALAAQLGLQIHPDEAELLTALLANQRAAQATLDASDLQDIVPDTLFSLEARDD
ncbi:MAG: hypothetical protein OXE46_14480 [Chloroflexi bacterium]|nr:hypothetical protein [Chloroflexota bacterium]